MSTQMSNLLSTSLIDGYFNQSNLSVQIILSCLCSSSKMYHPLDRHDMDENKPVPNHSLKGLKIKNEHSKLGNKHENNHAYCSGILKIAQKQECNLTPEEKVGHFLLFHLLSFHLSHFYFRNLQDAVAPLLKINHTWYQEQHM